MTELLKTIVMLSVIGGCLTMLLLILKPFTAKRLSAKWQYYIWLAVILVMIFPVWKCIPETLTEHTAALPSVSETEQAVEQPASSPEPEPTIIASPPLEYREIAVFPQRSIRLTDFLAWLWLGGTVIFLLLAFGSYTVFLVKKRRYSTAAGQYELLESVRKRMGVRRRIRVRISRDGNSPMLVGPFFPVLYLPQTELPPASLRMVLLHELTHYRRGDLLYKWLTLLVNAVHWFNPLAYLLSANIAEACEISCDMAVTKNMTDEEQKLYMKTILDLVQTEKGGK